MTRATPSETSSCARRALTASERRRLYSRTKTARHSRTRSSIDALLKAALLHACGEAAAKIYTWHSYRSGLATALHAAGVPDAVIMLMCRWMCEASLHVYRRSGAVAHEANFWAATRADVSNIQAANVPDGRRGRLLLEAVRGR